MISIKARGGDKMRILAMTCCCVDVFPEKNTIAVGGNALNLAVNCAMTNLAEVYLMGNIGNDDYGKEIIKVIDKYKIGREHLYVVEGQTANHIIKIAKDGDRYFTEGSWTDGVYGDYRISEQDRKYMNTMDAVAVTLYDPNYKDIINIRRNGNFTLAVDFHDESLKEEWKEDLDAIDLFFISGKTQELPELKKWSAQFPQTVFVATLGAKGSIAYFKEEEFVWPAEKVDEVIDTTGCGDSYQGAFIAHYLKTKDILYAMKEGSKSAARTLTHVGGVIA